MRVAIAIVVALIALAGPAAAQGTGTITGVVTSAGSHAVPDALMTLRDMDGDAVPLPDNPQITSNGTGNNVGVYVFYAVPFGTYNLTAEKDGCEFFAIVDVREGTASANVVLPAYVGTATARSPPEQPSRFYTFVPINVKRMNGQPLPPSAARLGLAATGAAGAALLLRRRRNGPA